MPDNVNAWNLCAPHYIFWYPGFHSRNADSIRTMWHFIVSSILSLELYLWEIFRLWFILSIDLRSFHLGTILNYLLDRFQTKQMLWIQIETRSWPAYKKFSGRIISCPPPHPVSVSDQVCLFFPLSGECILYSLFHGDWLPEVSTMCMGLF